MFAHEVGAVRPGRRSDGRDVDQYDQNQTSFQDFRIRFTAEHATEAINDVDCANASDRQLESAEKRGELDQADRTKSEYPANRENKLRAPDILKPVARRSKNAISVIA